MYKVVYTPQAEMDLLEIKGYISQDNPLKSNIVVDDIFAFINVRLSLFPKMGPKLGESTYRYIIEQKYRYRIVYKLSGDLIVVYSISKYKDVAGY